MRIGYIDISNSVILLPDWPDMLDQLLDRVNIIKQEEIKYKGIIRLHCKCKEFADVPENSLVCYSVIFKSVKNKPVLIRFER
jgi:hypothetical protein